MKQQESEVSGQGSGVEREPAVKGRDSGYLTRISVFLITLSGLILEVGLTRIYSASIWYHFAFVAISVALLGWGLGGLTVHLLKRKFPPSLDAAAVLALLYAVSIPISLAILVRFPFELARLPLYFFTPLVPFFL